MNSNEIDKLHKILKKYPDKIPVYIELSKQLSKELAEQSSDTFKRKYLLPNNITIAQFLYICRKNIKLRSEKGLYIFFNNKLYSTNELMSKIYECEQNEYGVLIASLEIENTFGYIKN